MMLRWVVKLVTCQLMEHRLGSTLTEHPEYNLSKVLTGPSFSSLLPVPIKCYKYPLVQSRHSRECWMIGHDTELSDTEVGDSVLSWTTLSSCHQYQHDEYHIVLGSWTFWCTHTHYRSLAVDPRIPTGFGARFLLKCGAHGTVCRTHSTILGDCLK
jgi:hypothetical protein